MVEYQVIVEGGDSFRYEFDGEPQVNLTFERDEIVYKVTTRSHDEDTPSPTIHARVV